MTEIETDPIGPIGPMGSGSSGGRRRKPSGGGQAITMILAWVGGAAAAVAVAFWVLQYVKPEPDPGPVVNNDLVTAPKEDDQKRKQQRTARPRVPSSEPKTNRAEPEKPLIDRDNFQRAEKPGLSYRYFGGESFGMSDFSTATPSQAGVVVAIGDLPPAKDAKGLQLEGLWETKTEQPCDFALDSTNDARLYIDDQLVLDNTTQFKREVAKASRTIEPGKHNVRVEFVLSTQGGNYKLEVGGTGDPNRWSLADLLEPFDSTKPKSTETLQYELASYPASVFETKPLMANNRRGLEAGFVEVVSATPVGDSEQAETVMPDDGQLLAGLAISSRDGRVAAIKPIYLDELGVALGEVIGQKAGRWEWLIAKPGYAVSAVQIEESDSAGEVSLEFMMIDEESLLPTGAYTQSLGGGPSLITINENRQPVVGLRAYMASDSSLLGIDALRVTSAGGQILKILAEGFPKPSGHKEAPSPGEVMKGMKKLMRDSALSLRDKKGAALKMEMGALARSTASDARANGSDDDRFIGLLEARRLYLLSGEFESAFAIIDELSDEFAYDYWGDLLAFFTDAVKLAGKSPSMQRQVVKQLGPAIDKAEEHFEFEVAGKLAAGGKMLATALEDQSSFGQFGEQAKEFSLNADLTKQARVAAKTLISRPDDPKANRVMGVFSLVVTEELHEAMKYFALSSNGDCKFIAEYDHSFDGSDAKIAMKLADCWKRIGKKNDALEKVAMERAQKILLKAKAQAQGKDLKKIESDLERL